MTGATKGAGYTSFSRALEMTSVFGGVYVVNL